MGVVDHRTQRHQARNTSKMNIPDPGFEPGSSAPEGPGFHLVTPDMLDHYTNLGFLDESNCVKNLITTHSG